MSHIWLSRCSNALSPLLAAQPLVPPPAAVASIDSVARRSPSQPPWACLRRNASPRRSPTPLKNVILLGAALVLLNCDEGSDARSVEYIANPVFDRGYQFVA